MTPKENIEAIYPLSPLQQGVLFHVLYEADSYYFQQWELELAGELDVAALRGAWDRLIERHPALRTSFVWDRPGDPLQVVRRTVTLPWEEYDWSDLPKDELERRWSAYVREDRQRGFDLSKAPLIRVLLIRSGPAEHRMLWSSHHLILDGWSHWKTFDELFLLYEAFRTGCQAPLVPARPYGDYIKFIRGHSVAEDEEFWRRDLAGLREPTHFSLEEPIRRPGEENYAVEWLTLDPASKANLETAARRARLTQNTFVQGAWAILCSRYTGKSDVVFGVTVSGRSPSLPGVEGIVGVLINTLPVRVTIDPDARVGPWLASLQSHQIEIREHQYSSLTEIQGWSEVPRGVPLFESLVIFENFPVSSSAAGIGGLRIREIGYFQRANYPLTISAIPGERVRLRIAYDRRQFGDESVRRMLRHLGTLLEGIVGSLDARLSELPMLTEGERRQILTEWNSPAPELKTGRCLQELFEARARHAPDAPAVEFEGARLSYGELNTRANQLARHLRLLGVGPDVLVAVCLDRSLEMIVALLGVLKAGGAYLPLDPAYPAERLAFMVEDARSPVLVTRESLRRSVPLRPEVRVCLVDRDAAEIGGQEGHDLEVLGSPESLAYVIYTSGSTGKPKGVLVTHRNVDRLFEATQAWFAFDENDVWSLFHSYAFDFSVWELWGALRHGARLVVVPHWVTRSPKAFRELLSSSGITVLNQTPSAFRQLIAEDAASDSALRLRLVIFGGEALEPAMLAPWFDRYGDEVPRLVNMYGITETTVHVTYHPLSRADFAGEAVSVIGRPIPDLQVYILDARLELCPAGVPGELYVGGAGLARGYLRRPELTTERFIANPFAFRAGERLYRSGDLGRYRTSGQIEYLGRVDQQVKIRGHRIELGEIEAALAEHPWVSQAIALVSEERPGDVRLAAYVVPRGEVSPTPAELRAFLKRSLPAHMVPSTFVPIDHFPLTPSGKIDRRALPVPASEGSEREKDFVAPRNGAEETVANIWGQVLGVDGLGAYDDFFERGGHSLLATQVVSRIRDSFGVELPIRTLFESSTVAEFAEALSRAPAAGSVPTIVPLDRGPRRVGRSDEGRVVE